MSNVYILTEAEGAQIVDFIHLCTEQLTAYLQLTEANADPINQAANMTLALLVPAEVPESDETLAKEIEQAILQDTVYRESPNGRGGLMAVSKGYSKAAALIHEARMVPRAMMERIVAEYDICRKSNHDALLFWARVNGLLREYGYTIKED